uniref:uncharacterized protein LOC120331171 n=1 Tax=Styela clava TaxID=7725 RepID=UPI00193A5BC7|nr:uncharacterized protein LOC120331171 [Styela clava]
MALHVANKMLPVISHPLSRLGSRESLSVFGSGNFRDGSQSADPALNRNINGDVEQARNILNRCNTSQDSRRATTEEVLFHLKEKFHPATLPSVRKLFRANDPKGEGRVPKEAFSRVLWQLYGYLTTRQIQNVLKRLDLDKQDCISFDDFHTQLRSFGSGGEPVKSVSNWVKAVNSLSANHARSLPATNERASLPPSTSRSVRSARGSRPDISDSATTCWNTLREKVQKEDFDPEHVFPSVCLGEGAFVVPAQFHECLRRLKIAATDDDVAKIYRRMDGASPYAVHTKRLFELLGLDPDTGRYMKVKPQSRHAQITPPKTPSTGSRTSDREPDLKRPRTSHGAKEYEERPISVARPRTSLDRSRIYDGDILQLISKKLEEGQSQLQRALQARDCHEKGELTKADLRFALAELGLPIKATDLEHFLVRNGLRRKDQRVNYKLLMRRLQTRSNRGLLHKVMRNLDHTFHRGVPNVSPGGVSAPVLEAILLDSFQHEFLELLAVMKHRDSEGTGILSLTDFRTALQSRFSVIFTEEAWEVFVASPFIKLVPPPPGSHGKDGFIAYNDFLAKFDVMLRPETADEDDPWLKQNVENEYSHLLEHKRKYLIGMAADPGDHTLRHDPRPLNELEKVLVDVFLNKFQTMKKEYDLIVREDFCRIDKEKFDYIMFRCGFILTASELSRLWLSLPITRPIESMSFPGLLRHVIKLHYTASKHGRFSMQTSDFIVVSYILDKMRQEVAAHWSILKKKLRFLDPMGTSRIPKEDMLQLVRGLRPNIIDLELHYMVEMLESRIPGKTNYFKFMEFFTKPASRQSSRQSTVSKSTPEPVLSDTTSVIALRPGPPPVPTRQHNFVYKRKPRPPFVSLRNAPTVPVFKRITRHELEVRGPKPYPHRYDDENAFRAGFAGKENDQHLSIDEASKIYRANVASLVRHPPSINSSVPSSAPPTFARVPPKQIPSLRRSLRKADFSDRGKLPVNTFRKVLQEYGVTFRDPNDLYHFLRHYDTKLSDQVSYERFLQNIANVA